MSTPYLSWGGIAAVVAIAVWAQWDTFVHTTSVHNLFDPAHLLLLAGLMLFSACGIVALVQSRKEHDPRILMGTRIVAFGGIFVFFSMLVLDELWHLIFGLDQTAWSPPHMAATFGMFSALLGMFVITVEPTAGTFRNRVSETKAILISAAMLMVLLFNFIEFDLPTSLWLVSVLPGFFYPVFLSWAIMTTFVLMFAVQRKIWAASIAAVISWSFFTATGIAVETATRSSYVEIPFPIFLPAISFDLLLSLYKRTTFPLSWQLICGIAAVTFTTSFWSIVGWSVVTALPQRLSGSPIEWVSWFAIFLMMVPLTSLIVYTAVSKSGPSMAR